MHKTSRKKEFYIHKSLDNKKAFGNKLIVMFVAHTPQAEFIEWYRKVYSPFDIIFYAKSDNKSVQSKYSSKIKWIDLSDKDNDKIIDDWYAHKCLLDCIPIYENYDGYLYMADDVLFRYWRSKYFCRTSFGYRLLARLRA